MKLQLMDCTLRDGANVVGKGFSAELTDMVLDGLTASRVPIIEFGNAGGIGAYEVAGFTDALTDEEYLNISKKYLNRSSMLGMFLNAKRYREKNVDLAAENGLSFLRVGADAGDGEIAVKAIGDIKKRKMKAFYSAMKAYILTPDELADSVRLPEHLASLPYLQEYYGTVEWSVRSIYTGYLGWFDGNPTKLGHMNTKERAEKTVAMMGGAGQVLAEGKAALERGEAQWAAELCDLLLDCGQEMEAASGLKADALSELGRRQTSANARHYYLACARQLRGNGETLKLNGAMLDVGKKQREA